MDTDDASLAPRRVARRGDAILIGRDDRLFPASFQRRIAGERLAIEADEIEGGHLLALSRPPELVQRLESYRITLDR